MDQYQQGLGQQRQMSISPVRFHNEENQYNQQQNGYDQYHQRASVTSNNSLSQNSFISPLKQRTKPKIFDNTPSYLQQTASQSRINLSFGSPSQNQSIDQSLQQYQQQVQQLVYEKETLNSEINNLKHQIIQFDLLLQQERRINRTVATEYMTKVPSAEKAIIQLNAENQRLHDQIDQDKKLCSTSYLKSLELENLRLTIKNKHLSGQNSQLTQDLQESLKLNQNNSLKSSCAKKQSSPMIKISLTCPTEDNEISITKNGSTNIEYSKSLNCSPIKQNQHDDQLLENYQNMEAQLLKLQSYTEILKQDNDQLEENNRILNKKLKILQLEKDTNDNEHQQRILKLESLVSTFEYQLAKAKNEQSQSKLAQYQNDDELQYINKPSSKIERNFQSNSNTIRILHDGDVNIKIEGDALNQITSVSLVNH